MAHLAKVAVFVLLLVKDFIGSPLLFIDKVCNKLNGESLLRRSVVRLLLFVRYWLSSSGQIRQLEETRNFAAIVEIHSAKRFLSLRTYWELVRAKQQIERLQVQIHDSVSMPKDCKEAHVMHYFTNSEPFTRSGYTERSMKVLHAQADAGITVSATTRGAYPLSIGEWRFAEVENIEGFSFYRITPSFKSLLCNEELREYVDKLVALCRRLQVTHLQTTTGYSNAVIVSNAAVRLGIPWVYEVRGELESTWLSTKPPELQKVAKTSTYYVACRKNEDMAMRAAAEVVVLSETSKAHLESRGIPSDKISVVPNAIDERVIREKVGKQQARKLLGLDSRVKLVGTVTSVVDYEGLDCMVEALKFLPQDCIFVVVGSGASLDSLKEKAHESGCYDRCRFVGRRPFDEALRWYESFDVFVVPRRDEEVCRLVTPIKAKNAQALGIPIVASDLPALREVTGGDAVFVVPENAYELARGVSLQLKRGSRNGDYAENELDIISPNWRENGERYRDIYNCTS